MKKYEFTGETIEKLGVPLQRIRALKDVKQGNNVIAIKGETGGWIAEEKNLSQSGNAWVSGDAQVSGNARVSGDAKIIKPTDILTVGPIGSCDATTTFFRDKSGGISVVCGCFLGTLDEFAEKVTATHGDSKHAKAYREAVEFAKVQMEEGQK